MILSLAGALLVTAVVGWLVGHTVSEWIIRFCGGDDDYESMADIEAKMAGRWS